MAGQAEGGLAGRGGGGDDDDARPCRPDPVSGRAGQWTALGSGRSWSTPALPTRRLPAARATWSPVTWCSGSPATPTN